MSLLSFLRCRRSTGSARHPKTIAPSRRSKLAVEELEARYMPASRLGNVVLTAPSFTNNANPTVHVEAQALQNPDPSLQLHIDVDFTHDGAFENGAKVDSGPEEAGGDNELKL